MPSLNNDSPNSLISICLGTASGLFGLLCLISLNAATAAIGSVGDIIAPNNIQ